MCRIQVKVCYSAEGSGAAARKAMYRGVAGRLHLMQPGPESSDLVVKNLRQAYKGSPTSLDPGQLADRSACRHHEICKHYQSSIKACAEVLQKFVVQRGLCRHTAWVA